MTELWPAPVPGAPFTARSVAHLLLAAAARDTADWSRRMVPAGSRPSPVYGGSLVADAVALRERADQVLAAAILVEREDGTDWAGIAEGLGVDVAAAHERWAAEHYQWRTELDRPDTELTAGEVEQARQDCLAGLDAWVTQHREHDDPDAGTAPVSAAMERMNPLLELLHLRAGEEYVAGQGTVSAGPGAVGERIAVLERCALVCSELAGRAEEPGEGAEFADEARRCRDTVVRLRAESAAGQQ
ncbi:hypothetical protein EV383_6262 [Pseudonocardia sediminis]|uniref:Uncharacterized protein n=2 Tax=Pseudonocardia sediminis TaxID=1397368 RepID=A0A4Q7UBQ9_PSEST|nr:hypothetical protein EV383_6262 [Pseudonocardia sediminis]